MHISEAKRISRYTQWANGRIIDRLGCQVEPLADAVRLVAHVLTAEHVWLTRIATGGNPTSELFPSLDIDQCGELARTVSAGWGGFFNSHIGESIDREAVYRDMKGSEFRTPTWEIIMHVALHGSYHRGQINTALKQAGMEPPVVDYIVFAREFPDE